MDISKYDVISFDLWGTLLQSNPVHKTARAQYFCERYNPLDLSLNEVYNTIIGVDIHLSRTMEATGVAVSPAVYIYNVLYQLGNDYQLFNYKKVKFIEQELLKLFSENYPTWIDGALELLTIVQHEYDKPIITVSNTGFASGEAMRLALHNLAAPISVTKMYFSDERLFSKPHPGIIKNVITSKMLHIGDSLSADFVFSKNIGADCILVNCPDVPEGIPSVPTLVDLIKQIKEQ